MGYGEDFALDWMAGSPTAGFLDSFIEGFDTHSDMWDFPFPAMRYPLSIEIGLFREWWTRGK
jgi:hypothetical protein